MGISTHVLNAVTGRAAAGMAVTLERHSDDGWVTITTAVTDPDGRIGQLAASVAPGVYRLTFATGAYLGGDAFYPEVSITVRVTEATEHYHVPLLLSPFAYSTYRGS